MSANVAWELLNSLDKSDQEKVLYFMRLLLKKEKYESLKREIQQRREEVAQGETLSHEEIWDRSDV